MDLSGNLLDSVSQELQAHTAKKKLLIKKVCMSLFTIIVASMSLHAETCKDQWLIVDPLMQAVNATHSYNVYPLLLLLLYVLLC